MNILIRNAKEEDLERLTYIYNWAVENTTASFDLKPQTIEKRREWFSHYGDFYPLIVAEFDGEVAGYASLSKFREKEGYLKTVEVSLYIAPEYQNKGIGKILLERIIEEGKKRGFHVIIAGITAGNEVSVRLHEKFGFVFCARLNEVAYKFEKWQDCLFYQLIME